MSLAHTLIAAVACILLVWYGCTDRDTHRGDFIAIIGAAGIVFVALT